MKTLLKRLKKMLQASINATRPKIVPDMLVTFNYASDALGLVTRVTRKHVHVVWLINPLYDENNDGSTNYHETTLESRKDLVPVAAGTKITLVNKER